MLLNWLKKSKCTASSSSLLPKITNASSNEETEQIIGANEEVEKILDFKAAKKRPRGQYNQFTPETRAKIAKFSIANGITKTSTKFSIAKSTVLSIRDAYKKSEHFLSKSTEQLIELPIKHKGRPTLLGDLEPAVIRYIKKLREEGCVVNRTIVIAAARGVIAARNRSLLKEYGGHIELGQHWAESFIKRLGYVKRKSTKAAKKLPPDFLAVKENFISRIQNVIKENNIPNQLVLNFDQTNLRIVPTSNWTLEARGSKQIAVIGTDDKREITAVLAISAGGVLLPPQLIYKGKTNTCHPRITFPADWDITHSESHWSTENTMLQYADKIIIPYCINTRQNLNLAEDSKALLIFDVFKAHQGKTFLDKLRNANIFTIFVPASCTGELQPLDLTINAPYKECLKLNFIQWYAKEIEKNVKANNSEEENVKVDLRLSVLKPLHAGWIISAHDVMKVRYELIINGFKKAGII